MKFSRCMPALAATWLLVFAAAVPAQTVPPPNTPPPAMAAPTAAPMSQDLLDSLLAPVALYPDQLLTQVLMASTYPLEVVEAARFVKANPNLRDSALDDALKDKTWDPSVLSLAAFPQVLDMMNEHLDWTQRLGDAFLSDEASVMNTVQSLRQKAQQAGNLQTTEQQRVVVQDRAIVIEPAQPQYVYVPVYNPTVIYGPWWAPAYRPWYWYPPPIWGYPPRPYNWGLATGFFWGAAWGISANHWGWCNPNWGRGTININVNNNNVWVNRPQYRNNYQNNGNWNHNVEHRRGVAYRDATVNNRYRPTNSANVQTRENYRGRDSIASAPNTGNNFARPAPSTMDRPNTGSNNMTRPAPGTFDRPTTANNMSRPTAPTGAKPQAAFQPESRPQVQRDANRGAQSRASMQRTAQPPQRAAPAQRPAPSANRGGGGGGGGGGGQGRGR